MKKSKILVSACLMGELVRYDGEIFSDRPALLKEWEKQGLIVSICPEVAGGLPTPRPPAEIQKGVGEDVVAGEANVIFIDGEDVTEAFLKGARAALQLAKEHEVKIAILKAYSPSCGSKLTYDGSFSDSLIEGQGVTAALLMKNGIRVFNESEINQVAKLI